MINSRWGGVSPRSRAVRFCALFLLVPLSLLAVYFFYPIYKTIELSFFDWNGIFAQKPVFVGLDNYRQIFMDKVIPVAVANNLKIFVVGAIVQLAISFVLAVFVVHAKTRASKAFMTIAYLPYMISTIVVGLIFTVMFSADGPVNSLLRHMGLAFMNFDWMGNSATAFPAILITMVWYGLGFTLLSYVVSLREVPESLLEAAKIDGANLFQITIHILIPFTWNMTRTLFILSTIGAFLAFDLIWVMTLRTGGPFNQSQTLVTWMYTHLSEMNFGYAAALSVLIFAITLMGTIVVYLPVILKKSKAGAR